MKKYFIFGVFCFIITSILLASHLANAQELDRLNLPKQSLNPGDFYYPVVRLWEKIAENFNFGTEAKFKYSNSLIDKRMSELGYVVKNKRLDEVQRSSQRLAYQVGTLTDFLIKQGNKQTKDQLKIKINTFFPALSELRDNFPANSSFWMLVQHDINSLKEYREKLK